MNKKEIAAAKLHNPRVEVICGDIEAIPVHMLCDRSIIHTSSQV